MKTLRSFQISSDLAMVLLDFSKTIKRSESFVVEKALEYFMDEYADAYIAKTRMLNPKRKFILGQRLLNNVSSHRKEVYKKRI